MVYRHSSVVSPPKQTNGSANGHTSGAEKRLEELKLEDDNGQQVLLDVNKEQGADGNGEAAQCVWLARVKPEDCENIVKYTLLQGKVVKPDRQLRGGFDRCKQLASW
jgi:(2Fe-2S) ferredoxin